MKESKTNRSLLLNVRLTEEEKQFLSAQVQATTCRTTSQYARQVLLKKPVIIKIRNQSQDELLTEIIALRNELKMIGTNLNQATRKLHTLRVLADFREWILRFDRDKQDILQRMDAVDIEARKLAKQWLPS